MHISFNKINNIKKFEYSFKGRNEVRQRAMGFATDIVEIAQQEKNIPKSKLEHVVREYLPSIVIRQSKGANGDNIFCAPYYNFSRKDNIFYLRSQTLHIPKIRPNAQMGEKADFVENISHEMAHAFHNVDEEISFVRRYNDYLKNNSYSQLQENDSVSEEIFNYLEKKGIYPLIYDLYAKSVGQNISDIATPKELLDRILPNAQSNLDEIIKTEVVPLKKTLTGNDMEFVLAEINDAINDEIDAYKTGFYAYKKFKRQDEFIIDDAIPELYKSLASATNKYF